MRRRSSLLLLSALLVPACKKAPPPSRPADVCAGVKTLADCATMPDGSRAAGSVAAANCYDVGNQQFHCGLFEQAGQSFQRSAELGGDPRAWHMLGEAYLLQERWSSAIDAYQKAVTKDPRKRDSWLRLGKTAAHQQRYELAHQAYAKAQALDPKRADAFDGEADVYAGELKFDEAVEKLRKVEALGDAEAKLAATQHEAKILSIKLLRLRRQSPIDASMSDDAADNVAQKLEAASAQLADALDRLSQLRPGDADLLRQLADARLGAADFDKAEQALQKAGELDPKDFISMRTVALLREKRNDAAGARSAVQASLKVQPKQALPYIILGRLDAASGNLDDAKRDFAEALAREDGKDATETQSLAELAEKVGALDKADALYKALDDDPEVSSELRFWLERARISQALGHKDQVKLTCGKAHALVSNATCPPAAPKR